MNNQAKTEELATGTLLTELRARNKNAQTISVRQACELADAQAELIHLRLLTLPFDCEALTHLIDDWIVTLDAHLSPSGMTVWNPTKRAWVTVINGNEPTTRQRFSVLHELKHLIDDPYWKTAYRNANGTPWPQADIELLCDYFAGCVLMPRGIVLHAWDSGQTNLHALSELFWVSERAMAVRLSQLGLRRRADELSDDGTEEDTEPHWYSRSRVSRTKGATILGDEVDQGQQPTDVTRAESLAQSRSSAHSHPSPSLAKTMEDWCMGIGAAS